MSQVFTKYANYYDKLYETKNYLSECDYIEKIIEKHFPFGEKDILDLGCGTGGHSIILSKRGWNVTGIDRSKEMIDIAKTKCNSDSVDFMVADIRDFQLDKKYDAAISMFAVVSYLTSNDDLLNLFNAIKKVLKKGGLFVFDVWFGPAVVKEGPSDRYRILEKDKGKIIRFVHSDIDIMEHVVSVNYKLLDIDDNSICNEVNETHNMRYFFPKEIELFLKSTGLNLLASYPFLEIDTIPSDKDWNVTFVARNE